MDGRSQISSFPTAEARPRLRVSSQRYGPLLVYKKAQAQQEPGTNAWRVLEPGMVKWPDGRVTAKVFENRLSELAAKRLTNILNLCVPR